MPEERTPFDKKRRRAASGSKKSRLPNSTESGRKPGKRRGQPCWARNSLGAVLQTSTAATVVRMVSGIM